MCYNINIVIVINFTVKGETMNYSKQREAMLNILRSTKTHPTANEIYVEMRKNDPKISLGTVYRNLALLTGTGTVMRIDTNQDSVHYDGCTKPHYHFVCDTCGRVIDLNLKQLDVDKEIEAECDCKVSEHMLIFYGKCSKCKNL